MITVTYAELLLTILTACIVVLTVAFVVSLARARSTLNRLDRAAGRLLEALPEVNRLSRETEATVHGIHELTDQAKAIASDLEAVTSGTRQAAAPLLHDLRVQAEGMQSAVRHASAVMAGARAGIAALQRNKR